MGKAVISALIIISLIIGGLSGCTYSQSEVLKIAVYEGYKTDEYSAYNQLNNEGKGIYSKVLQILLRGETKISVLASETAFSNIWDYVQAVIDDHPEFFWVKGGGDGVGHGLNFFIEGRWVRLDIECYSFWNDNANKQEYIDELNALVDTIVAEANKFETDYEKALFLHDYIIGKARYSEEKLAEAEKEVHSPECELIYSAYGCLVEGEAVCSGYTRAYKMLLNRLGIESIYVRGESRGEKHAWNCLNIDGEYYLTDVTWDDWEIDGKDYGSYEYFCLTDAEMEEDHTTKMENFRLPECDSEKYHYNGYYMKDYSYSAASNIINAQIERDVILLAFPSLQIAKKAQNDLIKNKKIYKIPYFAKAKKVSYSMSESKGTILFYK